MTINKNLRRTETFVCDGTQKVFPFTFKVFQPTDIAVSVGASDSMTEPDEALDYGTDFTVALNSD